MNRWSTPVVGMLWLSAFVAWPAAAGAATGVRPTFDCAQAKAPVEKLICGDAALARLDRRLDRVYDLAMKAWSAEESARQAPLRRDWPRKRNECAQSSDVRACVEASYKTRIVEVQIQSRQLKPPTVAGYACAGADRPLSAAYYGDTSPPSAVVTYGDKKVIAFVAPSGSGARYTAADVELWEHQGEATVDWFGAKLTCVVKDGPS
jgi:uncharacterized protein